jgi:hypothetical protein
LSQARNRTLAIACLNNLKQREIYWHSYSLDYNGLLVPNNSVTAISRGGSSGAIAAGASWCVADPTQTKVQNGMSFDYNR